MKDKNGRPLELRDFEAKEITGVQIGELGHKLWVCIDGVAVLRIISPVIQLDDLRKTLDEEQLTDSGEH